MSLLGAVRRPEYTGANRCWPCTYLNAAIVAGLAVVTAVVSPPLAVVVLGGGAALIALRGYVIPGTPAFGPKVAPYLPVEIRHGPGGPGRREPATDGGPGGPGGPDGPDGEPSALGAAGAPADDDGEATMRALLAAGVLVEDGDALVVADGFADAWSAEMAELRELDGDALAEAAADAAPVEVTGRASDDGRWISLSGTTTTWLLRVQAIADVAAVRAMADTDVPAEVRARAAEPLRMFVPECPTTGGRVVETTVSNCCGGTSSVYSTPEQHVLACADTDEVVYAFDEA
jgi:hypothetical protein